MIRTNQSINQSGEAVSTDIAAAQVYLPVLQNIITEGGYSAQQIFDVNKTGLDWKWMPNKTVVSKEEKNAPGFKASKDYVRLYFSVVTL